MKFRIQITLGRSPKQAFKLMRDTQAMHEWETNFTSFQAIKGARRKINSTGYRIYTEPDGVKTKVKEEVTAVKLDEKFAYQLTHQQFMSYVECRFIDQGTQTLLIEETEVRFRPALLNLLGFFMKGSMKKQRRADLMKFKQILEQS